MATFITLTKPNGCPIAVNLDNVTCMFDKSTGATFKSSEGNYLEVKESLSEILSIINKEPPMKVAWQPQDIRPGRQFGSEHSKERFIIGYVPSAEHPLKYATVSLSDGMVGHSGTKCDMAAYLTEHGYLPAELLDNKGA